MMPAIHDRHNRIAHLRENRPNRSKEKIRRKPSPVDMTI